MEDEQDRSHGQVRLVFQYEITRHGELEQVENTLIFTFDILPKLMSDEITEIHVDAKTGAAIKTELEIED